MIENNDDFEDIKKHLTEDESDDMFDDSSSSGDNLSENSEKSMEDIFADIPPMPSDYETTQDYHQDDQSVSSTNNDATVTVQPVKFASFNEEKSLLGDASKNLDNLLDIKLQLTVELGRTTLPVKKVLELTRGSIVELDKIAGEPVELYANGKLIAHGEVVVIEDNFGLRITSMSEPENKLNALK
ncbi:flagellar motor switch protein FliN [bacterium]|nr:flagellar motor switch protein FliN [bacterium]